jgi:hypothetical protein
LFSDASFNFSRDTLRRLVYTEVIPFPDGYGYDPTPRHDVPVVEVVNGMQHRALANMFAPLVLQRLADMPTKAAPGTTMSLEDLFTWTQKSVFGDLASAHPASSEIHRNLQRIYATMLARMAIAPQAGTPYDAQSLARAELVDLDARVKVAAKRGGLDTLTRAHLAALQTGVERALDAKGVTPAV